ncbi:MAG: carbohydrate-binding protein, partial [Clostridiaceae bacterium]|nr:carbohydrate-binding protein [Clostridiaceae bacterium]
MKKVLLYLVTFCMIISLSSSYCFSQGPASTKYGDLNGDGNVNSTDYSLAKRYLLEIISEFPISNGETIGDLNGDGKINSTDYSLLKRYILGIIDIFPVEALNPSQSPEPTDGIYQAEDASLYMAVTETVNGGYSGNSYVNYDNVRGSYIEWNVSIPSYGTYDLTFRYANGTTSSRPVQLLIST